MRVSLEKSLAWATLGVKLMQLFLQPIWAI